MAAMATKRLGSRVAEAVRRDPALFRNVVERTGKIVEKLVRRAPARGASAPPPDVPAAAVPSDVGAGEGAGTFWITVAAGAAVAAVVYYIWRGRR